MSRLVDTFHNLGGWSYGTPPPDGPARRFAFSVCCDKACDGGGMACTTGKTDSPAGQCAFTKAGVKHSKRDEKPASNGRSATGAPHGEVSKRQVA